MRDVPKPPARLGPHGQRVSRPHRQPRPFAHQTRGSSGPTSRSLACYHKSQTGRRAAQLISTTLTCSDITAVGTYHCILMEGLDQFGLRIQVRRTRHLHCLHSLVPAHDPSSLPHSSCGPYTPFLVRVVIGVQYVYDVDDGHSLNCPSWPMPRGSPSPCGRGPSRDKGSIGPATTHPCPLY